MENNVGLAEDRISELPDSIIHNEILSRLPTNLAVRTSILPKRWRWLWTGVPSLRFSYSKILRSNPNEAAMCMNYVDNVLQRHQISKLRSFRLTCDNACDESRIGSWISTVTNQNLHELDLHVTEHEPNVIPSSIYLCKSLVALKLLYTYSRVFFTLPTLISLPSLKTLELGCAIFEDEECHNACNLLEDLSNNKCVHLASSLLEALPHEDLMSHVPILNNLTYLRIFKPGRGIELLSVLRLMPNLEYLVFDKVYVFSEHVITTFIELD